jgi:alpha-glucosidase (family GH31 glycosyl hydrolase)
MILIRLFLDRYLDDANTFNIDRQFLIGRCLLVSPNLQSGATTVNVYFPSDRWYEFPSGVAVTQVGQFVRLNAPLSKINVHLRGGYIVPMQIPGPNLMIGRTNPFTLLVAQSASGNAAGQLFWDDGDSIGNTFTNPCALVHCSSCCIDSIETKNYNYLEFTLENAVSQCRLIGSSMAHLSCPYYCRIP